ncbi:hypothetical protein ACFLT0_00355 [Chloroflexota bacterium]
MASLVIPVSQRSGFAVNASILLLAIIILLAIIGILAIVGGIYVLQRKSLVWQSPALLPHSYPSRFLASPQSYS